MQRKYRTLSSWLSTFLLIAASITVYKTFDNFAGLIGAAQHILSLLQPFWLAMIFSYLLLSPTRALERKLEVSKYKFLKRKRRPISVLTVYFSFLSILAIAFAYLARPLSESAAELVRRIPEFYQQLVDFMSSSLVGEWFSLEETLLDIMPDNAFSLQNIEMYWSRVSNVTGVLFAWFMGLIICIYILIERAKLKETFDQCLSLVINAEKKSKFYAYMIRVDEIFSKFFFGQIIDSLIVGIMATVGFYILGIKYAGLLGVIMGMTNVIPYFGPIIGAIPIVLVTLLGDGFIKALWTGIFILVLQQFDGMVLNPKILGDSVGVSPFWIIFAVLLGGGLFGFWGMLLGIPVVAAVRLAFLDLVQASSKKEGENQ